MRLLALLGCSALLAAEEPVHQDRLELAVRHQTLDHFGASGAWSIQKIGEWSDEGRTKVADLLFSRERGLGLSLWRYELGAGRHTRKLWHPWRVSDCFEVEPGQYDWSRAPGERWFLRAAKARGVEKFLLFTCSPPMRLTRSGVTHSDGLGGTTNLKEGAEAEFAVYLADVLEHFRTNPDPAERIDFGWLSPVNEPEWKWDQGQDGCRYSNADLLRLAPLLAAELRRRELPTKLLLPEAGQLNDLLALNDNATRDFGAPYGDYLNLFTGQPELAESLGRTLGYHSYWTVSGARFLDLRRQLRARLADHPGWRVWQTEFCVMDKGRDLTMTTALQVARVIWADLTVANCASWSWWLAVSPYDYKDGLLYTDWRQPGDPEIVIPSKLFWAYGNYTRFVRPGMVRVELRGDRHDPRGLFGSAWLDEATGRLAVVYVNAAEEPTRVRLTANRGPAEVALGPLTPHLTSDAAGDDLRPGPPLDPAAAFTVPARSVLTVTGELVR